MNASRYSDKRVMLNREISNLMQILGLQYAPLVHRGDGRGGARAVPLPPVRW